MKQSIVHIALVVRDYDEAIEFYTKTLRFELIEDTYQPEQDKRWVVVAPPGSKGTTLLLARASKPEQEPFIGNQAGGRVFLFLNSDDFWRDYNEMKERASNSCANRRKPITAWSPCSRIFTATGGTSCSLIPATPSPIDGGVDMNRPACSE